MNSDISMNTTDVQWSNGESLMLGEAPESQFNKMCFQIFNGRNTSSSTQVCGNF